MAGQGITSDTQTRSLQWRYLTHETQLDDQPQSLDAMWHSATGMIRRWRRRGGYYLRQADAVLKMDDLIHAMTDAVLRREVFDMRDVFRRGRQTPEQTLRGAALIREVSFRQRGEKHYRVQVAAALALMDGYIAEMATGEGKTLMATIPATIFGWRGKGCHVLTVNDYLAARDAEKMSGVYKFCGLSCAAVTSEMKPEERRNAYQADITYSTNKDVCADFLRDRLALGKQRGLTPKLVDELVGSGGRGAGQIVMRGLHYAIIDEADSVLIDEAVTPLIISGEGNNEAQKETFKTAARIARKLLPDQHYKVIRQYREIELTMEGEDLIDELCKDLGGLWSGQRRRQEFIQQAITAREMFLKNKHYVVMPDEKDPKELKVVIVDEFTGRLMPDRTWRDGLHQAIEAKEEITVTPPKDTFARLSFQRFFRHYHHLCGMTGTAAEASSEFWEIYRLPTVKIPTHRPCIRKQWEEQAFVKEEDKWKAIIKSIEKIHATGRPILIGTRSVGTSELISEMLKAKKLPHQVLNAVYHAQEAQIVAGAGAEGQITVATNMAGRGTDIKLGRGVHELGGLHVLAAERNEFKRVDRQLFGRAGRQGDPGSAQVFISLEDEVVERYAFKWFLGLAKIAGAAHVPGSGRLITLLCSQAQYRAQKMGQRQRGGVAQSDEWLDQSLSFAGQS